MKELEIQHLKVDQGIGYPAARRIWESQHRQHTVATVVAADNDKRFAELNAKFDQLLNENARKDNQMSILMEKLDRKNEQIRLLFEDIDKRDQTIKEKEARITALEAALSVNNIHIPASTPISNTPSTEFGFETPALTGTGKETGTTKKQVAAKNVDNAVPASPSRSRSPRRSSRKRSKDRRSAKGASNQPKRLELSNTNGTNNKSTENTQATMLSSAEISRGKEALEKKQSGETAPKKTKEEPFTKPYRKPMTTVLNGTTMVISDDDEMIPAYQGGTEIESDMDFAASPKDRQSPDSSEDLL